MNLLSHDAPRGWPLRALITLVALALAFAPFLFPGAKPLGVAEKICVMALLAASYDLLLGYTGIVSFAHVMFFGIGSYGVGLALYALGPGWGQIALGSSSGSRSPSLLAFVIGLLSLRVQAIFFAMVTLAIAYAFNVLASQLSDITGGEDGRSFQIPDVLKPASNSASSSASPSTAARSPIISCLPVSALLFLCCCASSIRRSAACCRRSAKTRSAPRRSAIAPSSIARSRPALPRPSRRRRARSTRSGCAMSAPTPRSVPPSRSTCSSSS